MERTESSDMSSCNHIFAREAYTCIQVVAHGPGVACLNAVIVGWNSPSPVVYDQTSSIMVSQRWVGGKLKSLAHSSDLNNLAGYPDTKFW